MRASQVTLTEPGDALNTSKKAAAKSQQPPPLDSFTQKWIRSRHKADRQYVAAKRDAGANQSNTKSAYSEIDHNFAALQDVYGRLNLDDFVDMCRQFSVPVSRELAQLLFACVTKNSFIKREEFRALCLRGDADAVLVAHRDKILHHVPKQRRQGIIQVTPSKSTQVAVSNSSPRVVASGQVKLPAMQNSITEGQNPVMRHFTSFGEVVQHLVFLKTRHELVHSVNPYHNEMVPQYNFESRYDKINTLFSVHRRASEHHIETSETKHLARQFAPKLALKLGHRGSLLFRPEELNGLNNAEVTQFEPLPPPRRLEVVSPTSTVYDAESDPSSMYYTRQHPHAQELRQILERAVVEGKMSAHKLAASSLSLSRASASVRYSSNDNHTPRKNDRPQPGVARPQHAMLVGEDDISAIQETKNYGESMGTFSGVTFDNQNYNNTTKQSQLKTLGDESALYDSVSTVNAPSVGTRTMKRASGNWGSGPILMDHRTPNQSSGRNVLKFLSKKERRPVMNIARIMDTHLKSSNLRVNGVTPSNKRATHLLGSVSVKFQKRAPGMNAPPPNILIESQEGVGQTPARDKLTYQMLTEIERLESNDKFLQDDNRDV